MPAAVPIILGVSALITAGAATYQAVDANDQRQKAKGEANKQADAARVMQNDLLKQQKDQQEASAADQAAQAKTVADKEITGEGNAARDAARRRQQALKAGAGSRQSTILTSPLGDTGAAPTASRTLLGG